MSNPVELAAPMNLSDLILEVREVNRANGWAILQAHEWTDTYKIPAILALIHSEVSEALEAFRHNDKTNFAEELADILIRVLDCAGGARARAPALRPQWRRPAVLYAGRDPDSGPGAPALRGMPAGMTHEAPDLPRVTEWRWANEHGANGIITVEEAEWLGYRKVAPHPLYPASWLMRRDG